MAASGTRGTDEPSRRPWIGAVIVVLLVAGVLFVGDAGLWLAREAVQHREVGRAG